MDARDRLIVALDILDEKKCLDMIEVLSEQINYFKIGIAPFTGFGETLLSVLAQKRKKVFLDLKFHDIPNTVMNVARVAATKNIHMMNFHCLGGETMLQAAVNGARKAAETEGKDSIRNMAAEIAWDKVFIMTGIKGLKALKLYELIRICDILTSD